MEIRLGLSPGMFILTINYRRPPRIRVGINGHGPIARNFLRCTIESDRGVDVVAINAPDVTPELMAYLIKYNSVYSPCPGVIKNKAVVNKPYNPNAPNCLMLEICGRNIAYFDYKNPADIPWHWMDVEYVVDVSDHLVKLEDAEVSPETTLCINFN